MGAASMTMLVNLNMGFRKAFGESEHRAAFWFGDESEGHGEEDAEDDDL